MSDEATYEGFRALFLWTNDVAEVISSQKRQLRSHELRALALMRDPALDESARLYLTQFLARLDMALMALESTSESLAATNRYSVEKM